MLWCLVSSGEARESLLWYHVSRKLLLWWTVGGSALSWDSWWKSVGSLLRESLWCVRLLLCSFLFAMVDVGDVSGDEPGGQRRGSIGDSGLAGR